MVRDCVQRLSIGPLKKGPDKRFLFFLFSALLKPPQNHFTHSLLRDTGPRSSAPFSHREDAGSGSARLVPWRLPQSLKHCQVPLDLLADEYPLVRELLQGLCGGRHLLAAWVRAVPEEQSGKPPPLG